MNKKFILSVLNILTLCVVITAVSISFIEKDHWMGLVLIVLALLCLASLIPFKINLKSVLPDVLPTGFRPQRSILLSSLFFSFGSLMQNVNDVSSSSIPFSEISS